VLGQDDVETVAQRHDVVDGDLAMPAHREHEQHYGSDDDERAEALECVQRWTRLGRAGEHAVDSPLVPVMAARYLVRGHLGFHRAAVDAAIRGCDGLGPEGK
jgi:hypothetical protein